jgi:hypothetical protein
VSRNSRAGPTKAVSGSTPPRGRRRPSAYEVAIGIIFARAHKNIRMLDGVRPASGALEHHQLSGNPVVAQRVQNLVRNELVGIKKRRKMTENVEAG